MLQLKLLGAPQVFLNQSPSLNFPARKTEALLFYLSITRRPQARDLLAMLFWPDLPMTQARRNLRESLSDLRHVLDDYLLTTRETIAFNLNAPYQVDTESFLAFVQPEQGETKAEQLAQVLELYRGEFLHGFTLRDAPEFDRWVVNQRQYFHQLAVYAFDQLARYYLQHNDIRTSVMINQRLLQMDPYLESAHERQIYLLTQTKRRSAALHQYENYRRLLAEKFSAQPSIHLQRLYANLLESDL